MAVMFVVYMNHVKKRWLIEAEKLILLVAYNWNNNYFDEKLGNVIWPANIVAVENDTDDDNNVDLNMDVPLSVCCDNFDQVLPFCLIHEYFHYFLYLDDENFLV